MADLPTGTLTFLFTDIAGSSRLWEQFPEPMQQAHARHGEIITACVIQHGGCFVRKRGEGDSTFSVFTRATDALAACCDLQRALAAQQWPADTPLTVRAALHVGTGNPLHDDYNNTDVNRCAHLRSLAHGEQTVLSQTTYELVKNALPQDVTLHDLGWHGLKNLQEPEHVWQMCHPALRTEFPPLNSLNTLPNNLPRPLSSFIGRDEEMRTVKALLRTHPLVTLTGTGGAGKTRLALEVGADILEQKEHGVWFVEFAALRDAALVPQTVIAALGLREEPGRDLTATLQDYLKSPDRKPRKLLLILDNCEHLIQTCALLADTLLRACPELQILATSREALNIVGEEAWRVPSLSVPAPSAVPIQEKDAVAVLMEYDAVRLFVERARQRQRGFVLDRQNTLVVAQIVCHLDGIPLALELAAARLNTLSVTDLAVRLEDRFRLLVGGSRTSPSRQQTLRAAMDWSYDLLNDREKALLGRLSVFVGGWSLAAAEQVSSGVSPPGERFEEGEVLDLLSSLVNKSLVIAQTQQETPRYRLLETVRQYAYDRLMENAESKKVRERHRDYFLQLTEEVAPKLKGSEQKRWLDVLEEEHDNLRQALAFCLEEAEEGEAGLRLGGGLQQFWWTRGYLREGRERLTALLNHPSAQEHTKARANALNGLGGAAYMQGDYTVAYSLFEESRTIYRELGDKQGEINSLINLGSVAGEQGDHVAARSLFSQSLDIAREVEDERGMAIALGNLGLLAHYQGDYPEADSLHKQNLAIQKKLGDKGGMAASLLNLGFVAGAQGDYDLARLLYEESLEIQQEVENKNGIANLLSNLGSVANEQGDYVKARSLQEESLKLVQELKDKSGIAYSLEALASLAIKEEQEERSARLWGAAAGLRKAIGSPLPPHAGKGFEHEVASVQKALGEAVFAAAWEEGRAMTMEQAIVYALQETPQSTRND